MGEFMIHQLDLGGRLRVSSNDSQGFQYSSLLFGETTFCSPNQS